MTMSRIAHAVPTLALAGARRSHRFALLGLVLLLAGCIAALRAQPLHAQPALSEGCMRLNDPMLDADYRSFAQSGFRPFLAGERIRITAEPVAFGGNPTAVNLFLNDVQVRSTPFPGTIPYIFPSNNSVRAAWGTDVGGARFTVSCDHPLPPAATLTAAVTPAPIVPAGQPLTWMFTVTNTGPAPLPGATFSATLPAGVRADLPSAGQPCTLTNAGQRPSCALGTLAAGKSVTIAIPATMLSVALGTNLCATGQLNAGEAGLAITRVAEACTRVGPPLQPDLQVTGLSCATPMPEQLRCTAIVTNTGSGSAVIPDRANILRVAITFPGRALYGCSVQAVDPPGYGSELVGLCSGSDATQGLMYAKNGAQTLRPGQSVALTFSAFLNGPAPAAVANVTATADPGARVSESNEANNVRTLNVTLP
jgi:uncharacterized repeat protein (TIGR01451 family)